MWCQYKVHGAKSGREAAIEAALRSEGGRGGGVVRREQYANGEQSGWSENTLYNIPWHK